MELPQALTAGQESVALFERLLRQRPPVFTGDLRGHWRPWPLCSKVSAAGTTPTAFATESTPSSQPNNHRGDREAAEPRHLITTAHDGAQTNYRTTEPAGRREPNQRPDHDHNNDHDQDGRKPRACPAGPWASRAGGYACWKTL
ncbi:MAG: hypothetical protein LC749_06925 [Actinobacteria bacterium]|nr:hypothetical protein [Actinomycetota bacterium]